MTKPAASVAGTLIFLINLLESNTQWTTSSYGIDLKQMPREDSVCHYKGKENKLDEVLKYVNLIYKSGKSILELAEEILTIANKKLFVLKDNEMNMQSIKEKLIKLYLPQARAKNIQCDVSIFPRALEIPFPRNKLLQIAGYLISNANKFRPSFGKGSVSLDMEIIRSVEI